jgi:hypothetical protein
LAKRDLAFAVGLFTDCSLWVRAQFDATCSSGPGCRDSRQHTPLLVEIFGREPDRSAGVQRLRAETQRVAREEGISFDDAADRFSVIGCQMRVPRGSSLAYGS